MSIMYMTREKKVKIYNDIHLDLGLMFYKYTHTIDINYSDN